MTRKKQFLKIGCWNVQNLKSKTCDKSTDHKFLQKIKGYDIFGLLESKIDEIDNISFQNFNTFAIPRPKENGYPVSGGILILYKPNLKSGISVLKGKTSELQWLKLEKTFLVLKMMCIYVLHT